MRIKSSIGAACRRLLAKPRLALCGLLREDRGSSITEAAMVISFLLMPALMGIVEFANVAFASIEVSNAAHAGAAYAAQYYMETSSSSAALPTQTQVTTVATGDSPDLQKLMSSSGTLTVSMSTGCGTGSATSGNSIPACSSPTLPYVKVTTTAQIVPMIHLPGMSGPFSVSTTAMLNLVN